MTAHGPRPLARGLPGGTPFRGARRRGTGIAAALLAVALALPGAGAAQTAGGGPPGAGAALGLHVLDGMTFVGTFGPRGSHGRDEDSFVFQDGLFTSTGCVEYGFSPRPYWVREEGGAVHFLAEMISEEHGTIVYTGRVQGDVIDATYVWTRDRWYWRVEREFWFKGRLTRGGPGNPAPGARGSPEAPPAR